ncbi:MAG: 4Fe-4S binding protein [Chloroflexi bacterium]|nr:4Fe-4S binding protein [Chloroflexota bacterium]
MNLFSVAGKLAPADQPPVSLEATRCVRAKDKRSTCELCVRGCPVNALRLDAPIALDEKACVACGLCLRVCPVGAFAGDDSAADIFNCIARLSATQVVELVCARHPAPEKGLIENATVIRTSACLAALGSSTYLRLLTQVSQVAIRMDACEECSIGRVQPEIVNALAPVRQLFPERVIAVTDRPSTDAKTRVVYDAKAPPVSRRDFLRVLTGESVRTAVRAFANESADAPAGSVLPRERVRLINALKQLALGEQNVPAQFTGVIRLTADDQCTACGVCARACPTGALQFSTTEGNAYRLTCAVAKCTDCGVCLDVCEPQALHRNGAPSIAELVAAEAMVLKAGALKQCAKCNALFADHIPGTLCPICDFRRRNPFGSLRPHTAHEGQS